MPADRSRELEAEVGPVLAALPRREPTMLPTSVLDALRVVEAEALVTRYRLHAITDRWIPRLEQALAEVTLAIEEQELADAARLRLASGPGSRRRDLRACPETRAVRLVERIFDDAGRKGR